MISPALHFHGNCAEAIALYQRAFDTTIDRIAYYRDAPASAGISGDPNWIMHGELHISGTRINMADSPEPVTAGDMIVMNVFLPAEEDVTKAYQTLKEGGEVVVELGPVFWSSLYGAVKDRFGNHWQIMVG